MFYLDTREADLIKILGENASVRQLPVGDIWIGIQETTSATEEEKAEW